MLARANALAQTQGVAYAEPDMMVTWHADLLPSDPGFSDSWGLRNIGQSGGQVGFDLKATSAWDTTVGSASVIVLVLDDGVQQNHPDINQIPGKDFTSDAFRNPTGGPVGTNDNHGTAVAGCVSERMNNGFGTTGIAPGVKIASARFATNKQSDGSFTTFDSWIINALNWGLSIGARVSNNSNGTDVSSSAVESAYNSTRASGMTHFASGREQRNFIPLIPGQYCGSQLSGRRDSLWVKVRFLPVRAGSQIHGAGTSNPYHRSHRQRRFRQH
jgi:hypothetical protein